MPAGQLTWCNLAHQLASLRSCEKAKVEGNAVRFQLSGWGQGLVKPMHLQGPVKGFRMQRPHAPMAAPRIRRPGQNPSGLKASKSPLPPNNIMNPTLPKKSETNNQYLLSKNFTVHCEEYSLTKYQEKSKNPQ